MGNDDVGGDVIGALLYFSAVEQSLIINDLEVDGDAILLFKGLDDLVDEEFLLSRRAKKARREDKSF